MPARKNKAFFKPAQPKKEQLEEESIEIEFPVSKDTIKKVNKIIEKLIAEKIKDGRVGSEAH